jgi:hypothetical protein
MVFRDAQLSLALQKQTPPRAEAVLVKIAKGELRYDKNFNRIHYGN